MTNNQNADGPISRPSLFAGCGMLVASVAGLWLLLAVPAWSLSAALGLERMSVAAGLCLASGVLVLAAANRLKLQGPQAAAMIVGATAFRLLFVLAGSLAASGVWPDLGSMEFMIWVVVFYLSTLAVETLVLVRRLQAVGTQTVGARERIDTAAGVQS